MGATELTGGTAIIAALISILIGIANCFFGYRIFRILLGIIGFIAGALAGVAIVQALVTNGTISSSSQLLYSVLAALIGGALGAVLLIFAYFIGVFLLGAFTGLALGYTIAQALRAETTVVWIVAVVLGLVGGVLAVILQRVILIIATAIGGALYIVAGFALLLAPRNDLAALQRQLEAQETTSILVAVFWFVLAVAGMIVQFLWTGKKKPKLAPAGAMVGTAAGVVPQVNVTVQQHNVAGPPVQPAPPIVYQSQPMAAPPPIMPVVIQAPPASPPVIPAPAQQAMPPLPAPEQQVVQSFPSPTAGGSKFCPNCGQPLTYGTTFCTNCGSSVTNLWQ
jgi:hypothetical protein